MTVLLTPSVDELEAERERLLSETRLSEDELRERAESFLLTADEARVMRRLQQIRYLLGSDEDA